MSLKVVELKEILSRYTSDVSGKKQDLAIRLIERATSPGVPDNAISDVMYKPSGDVGTLPPSVPIHFPSSEKTAVRFSLIDPTDLLHNSYVREYLSRQPEELPTLDGRNHSSAKPIINVEKWDDDHVKACRVVPIPNLPLESVLPESNFHLTDAQQVYVDDFAQPTLEDLRNPKNRLKLVDNNFRSALQALSYCMSFEEIGESRGRALLGTVMEPIFQLLCESSKTSFTFSTSQYGIKRGGRTFSLGGMNYNVPRNLEIQLREHKEKEKCGVPVAGLISRHPKPFSLAGASNSDVQDVSSPNYGEEIGIMLSQVTQNVKEYGMQDQEAYIIALTHTRLHVSAAFFPQDHMITATTTPVFPRNRFIYLFQSEGYELGTQEGRRAAAKSLFALTKFWLSGEARVARLNRLLAPIQS
ncbi:hypothetical protein BT69DRAFT_355777 [Atractiella rhizophila]|nr:hypothetical protein BT69DRAFT_355777 [Atractiella rhizophila]